MRLIRPRHFHWPILLLLTMPLLARADPSTPDQNKEIQALISKLGDPDFKARDAAQKALAAYGADSIPALEEAAKGDDPEIASRAQAVIQSLRNLGRETRVTLHLTNVTARQALDALLPQ